LAVHLIGYYRAGEKGLKVTIASLASAVSLIVLTTIFLRVLKLGIEGALLAQTLVYGVLCVFLLLSIVAQTKLRISLPLSWKLVKFGLPLILVMSGSLVTQGTAFYFLSYFGGLDQVGIYSLGMKIALIVEMLLILPFQMAYEPFVYGHTGDPELWNAMSRLLTYSVTALAFFAAAIAFAARDLLVLMAPPAFGAAYPVIFIILPALAFRPVYYVGESLLLLEKRTDMAATIVTAFTAVSIALNYFFISWWGMYGAAAAMSLTMAGTGAAAIKLGLGMAPIRLEKDRLAVAGMLLVGFLFFIHVFRTTSPYVYHIVVPLGICSALALLYASRFIKDDERRVIESFIGRVPRERSYAQ